MGWVENKLEEKLEGVVATVTEEAERTRDELAGAFATTLRGVRIDGALSRPIRPNAINYGSGGRLVGWSLRAVTADVTVTLHDGQSADADTVATVVIPAGRSDTSGLPGSGVAFVDALYAEVTTTGGSVAGAVWIGAVD